MNNHNKDVIGVYILQNTNTIETYVGSGYLRERERRHFSSLKNNKHPNYKLQRAYNNDQSFEFIGIEVNEPELTRDENRTLALALEQEIIHEFKDNPLFLNIALDVTAPMWGAELTEEHRMKISSSNKGKKMPPRTKEQIVAQSEKMKRRWEGLPDEEKRKINDLLGNYRHGEANGRFGRETSDETRKLQSDIRKEWYKNNSISEETRRKLSVAGTGRKDSEETKLNKRIGNLYRSKPVLISGTRFATRGEAAETLNVSVTTITNRIKKGLYSETN